jgi:biopolymer transport protein ExbB/TolQ
MMGIVGSFGGSNGPSPFCLAAVADGLADALARAALGLLVGILSLPCYRYLSFQLEDLDIEMRNMGLNWRTFSAQDCGRNHEPHAS